MKIEKQNFEVDGIYVERVTARESSKPPLLFVHGGCHGSWHWHRFMDHFAVHGWDCYALNWYNHYKSRALPEQQFIQRNLADVAEEVEKVVDHIGRQPVVIGHSMGGMVSQQYAQRASAPLPALVLVASVIPRELGAANIELPAPIDDTQPFLPPPYEFARELFFQAVEEQEAQREYALLGPESPAAVRDAIEHRQHVDRTKITCPVLVLGAELDLLTPEPYERRLAEFYGADYLSFSGMGHNLMTVDGWQEVAGGIRHWLERAT